MLQDGMFRAISTNIDRNFSKLLGRLTLVPLKEAIGDIVSRNRIFGIDVKSNTEADSRFLIVPKLMETGS